MNKLTFLLPFLCILIAFGADPQQPKVGGTPVINATNGYGGNLTIRTQINLGLAGSEGALTTGSGGTQLLLNGSPVGGGNSIWSTNTDGTIQATSAATNSLLTLNTNRMVVTPASLYLASGLEVFEGGSVYSGDGVISIHAVSNGDPTSNESVFATAETNNTSMAYGGLDIINNVNGDSTTSEIQIFANNSDHSLTALWDITSSPNASALSLQNQSGYLFKIFPNGNEAIGETDYATDYTLSTVHTKVLGRTNTWLINEARDSGAYNYAAEQFTKLDAADPLNPTSVQQLNSFSIANNFADAFTLTAQESELSLVAQAGPVFGPLVTVFSLNARSAPNVTSYYYNTISNHTSGNLAEFRNAGALKQNVTFDGVDATVGGFSSSATDAAVTIASTGWTNTFGKNAVVYLDGIGLTFKVANNAGTFVYTNSVALAGDSVLVQPNGKIIITGGTLGVGRATPF